MYQFVQIIQFQQSQTKLIKQANIFISSIATVLLLILSNLYLTIQMEITECPILHPTLKEFQNFYQFAEKVDKLYKNDYGMVKVVPPPQWKPRTQSNYENLDHITVEGPIQQNIFGKGGVYQCLLIQKKSLSLKQYKAKTIPLNKIAQDLTSQEVQKLFWRNISFSPPLYGADLLNTLMDDSAGNWNMNNLNSLLKYSFNTKVKGVNTPYCYIGSWKTMFCWHKEDLDLAAINYLHEGKSKFWYSIPACQGSILQKQAIKQFPQHFRKCNEFLRHKTTMINPYVLKEKYPQLKISKIQHKKNQFILVLGGAYHAGFNFGFNIAEAINYGTLDWLRKLLYAKSCSCSRNNVQASLIQIYRNLSQSSFKNTKQFKEFQSKLFEQQAKEENSKQVKLIKSQLSKKIKKTSRAPKSISVKGQQYQIDNWVQCDLCGVWRKIGQPLKSTDRFNCKKLKKKCNQKQKIERNLITI